MVRLEALPPEPTAELVGGLLGMVPAKNIALAGSVGSQPVLADRGEQAVEHAGQTPVRP